MTPAFLKGTILRDWYEFSVRIEKVKREIGRAFGYDRGAPQARRRR